MSEPSVQLTGSRAWVVAVLIIGLIALRSFNARTTLDTQGRETLREWVALELQRPLLDEASAGMESGEMDEAAMEGQAQAILAAGDVRIASMRAKGPLDDLVVRIELEPSPGLPPGTERVRYYRMEYSSVTGWRHRGDATALSWYLKIY
jgi:hypothetical protein